MKVLIDTNVALTYLSGREDPFSEAVNQIMLLCARGKIEAAIASFFIHHLVSGQKASGGRAQRLDKAAL